MIRYFFFLSLFFFTHYSMQSQKKELFDLIITDENATPSLLPKKMIFTQKIFWGERGILRKTGIAPLNLKNREKELKLRKSFIQAHEILEYVTLSAMISNIIVGDKYYSGDDNLYKTFKTTGDIVNAGYLTGLTLSLFSPPPPVNKKTKGFGSKTHKFLSNIHLGGMIITNIVSDQNKKAHKAATYSSFASYATAVLVFKFQI